MYTFSNRAKKLTYLLMLLGIIALGWGIAGGIGGQRIWSNVLINSFFFFSIALAATFFLAVQYAAEAAWAVVLKRVMEAVSSFLPIGAILLMIVFAAGTFGVHHLYHWMDHHVIDPASEHYDELIAHKQAFLNQPFFWARVLLFLGVYVYFQQLFRKRSLQEDATGGVGLYKKNITAAAIFLVFFGFTSTVASWDWLMSIDTHWYSTLFGWYTFSGMWVSAIIFMTLLVIYLKRKGLLQEVTESHIHDMGKWMFAISFLWSYLWFCQYMLIWYSNIPEEVTYYVARIEEYRGLLYGIFFVNFVFPMLILMDKSAKRNNILLIIVGSIIFVGHWLDVYLMVTPGTMKTEGHLGLFELGLALGYLGLFIYIVLNALSKAPVMVKNHPFLEESLHFHQ
jgi:hypothetical protein